MGGLCFSFMISANLFFLSSTISLAVDGITPSQSVLDGTTLVSSDGSFELGFFSPGSSKNRYLGIWFKNVPVRTVVWVANRCNPINDSSGVLMINSTGNLVLLSQNSSVVWSPSLVKQAQNATVELLDSGNLVLRDAKDGNSGTHLWQSFDHPSDTLLPGMKLGWDLRTGLKRHLSAWKNSDDPCPGDFTYGIGMEHQAYPEAYILNGSTKFFRTSAWNGLTICGSPEDPSPRYSFNFVYNDDEVYVTYKPKIESILSRVVLNQTTSTCARFQWKVGDQAWQDFSSRPTESCDYYGFCGANGNCTSEDPVCKCIQGFSPKSQEKWNLSDWSLGCVRNKPLSCHERDEDEFLKFDGFKLPDTTNSWVDKSMNLKECRAKCLKNCSCTAYTSSDIGGGSSGCTIWFGDLIDIKQVPVAGKEIYIRTSAADIGENSRKVKIATVVVGIAIVFSGVLLVGYVIRRRKRKNKEIRERNEDNEGAPRGDMELPLFDLMTVASATDNFSSNKKLGEGGFGPVYKGTLADGQEIAVKRLSRSSGQGLNEFMNEVRLIAKLQHRNLVRLLGCCVQGEEKLLLYEYMPNGSLDSSIFDETRREPFDWPKRFNIICGIARGLVYLHQDSRLRIIHRDLKASNVLLDNEMNPKISDFGLARLLTEGDSTVANTERLVGTYGYMAPEYVMGGQFSVKSDVFSFGILVLEIVTGRKNKGFFDPSNSRNLSEQLWRLWNEGKPLELIDTCLASSGTLSEVLRCINIGLLCAQHDPDDRPSMAAVVIMLGSETALAQPKQPGFFMEKGTPEAGSNSGNQTCSTNELSISLLEAR
ncbi:G-type lectin S-receptor-like serine/threonine-protein kinase At4g27290 isoform X2 [Pyrus x bretschneideri]|uniref:G-type lectin S-receptor-like serine/threonine-protein kinase At4g27290 isoform X2 n=1 Tax=Pyrus x bretschneideri TaxID=225117 RepID=UPI00202E9A5B|nr:G-type lectin S-receptor-like serine/threonine-protein kinase At4g27290 isoform X2 [Pyrus x bretschneideri]